METILFCLAFAGLVIFIVVFIAFKYAKPTTNNYGTIHNHYYGQDEKESPKELPDKNALLLAQCAGELLKAVKQNKKDNPSITLNDSDS